jgi:MFS family permease
MTDQRTEPSPTALGAALVAVLLVTAASPCIASGATANLTGYAWVLCWCLILIFSVAGGLLAVAHGVLRNSQVVFLRGLGGVIAGYLLGAVIGLLLPLLRSTSGWPSVTDLGKSIIFFSVYWGVGILTTAVGATAIAAAVGSVIRLDRAPRPSEPGQDLKSTPADLHKEPPK